MGTRFLALLLVSALGAGTALVGLSVASGSWDVVGTGLAPGSGYALFLTGGADRLKLDLANATSDGIASFTVFAPTGQRVGHYELDAANKAVEIVAGAGAWTLFVYKAHGGDLTLAVHGQPDAGMLVPAIVERKEVVLGEVHPTQAVDATYTAMLDKEPVLAGVYLRGSARGFDSELSTSKGVVEVVHEDEVNAVGGMVVSAQGVRATLPMNLEAGPYTAKVRSDSLSGSLLLMALYLLLPDNPSEAPVVEPDPPPAPRPHRHAKHAPAPPVEPEEDLFAECGEAHAWLPYALDAPGGVLRLTLVGREDPWVTIFDPDDEVLANVELKEEGDEALVDLLWPGQYVLFARGGVIAVELLGVEECELLELDLEPVSVASFSAGPLEGFGFEEAAEFSLGAPPLAYLLVMESPESTAFDLRALFTGPEGEAMEVRQPLQTSFLGGGFMGWWQGEGYRAHGHGEGPEKLVKGDWTLDVSAGLLQGDLEAYVLHYVRDHGKDIDDEE